MPILNDIRNDSIATIELDTIIADSALATKSFNPAWINEMANREDAFDIGENKTTIALPAGRKGEPLSNTPLNDAGTMGLVMMVFFFLAISFRNGYKYIADIGHHMFSVRKRQNAFESHTVSETQVMLALLANTCLMIGILFYVGINLYFPNLNLPTHVFASTGSLTLLTVLFMLSQFIIYNILGYVFARDSIDTKLWIDGFKSTQSLLGLMLFPIVFIILLYPASTHLLLNCSVFLYFCMRFVFIYKGFRIFFNNLSSCVYFILYLCTVEIVPVFLMCIGAFYLCEII